MEQERQQAGDKREYSDVTNNSNIADMPVADHDTNQSCECQKPCCDRARGA